MVRFQFAIELARIAAGNLPIVGTRVARPIRQIRIGTGCSRYVDRGRKSRDIPSLDSLALASREADCLLQRQLLTEPIGRFDSILNDSTDAGRRGLASGKLSKEKTAPCYNPATIHGMVCAVRRPKSQGLVLRNSTL